jgi:hypothetical protein
MRDKAINAGAYVEVLRWADLKYLSCRPEILMKIGPGSGTSAFVSIGQDGENILNTQTKVWFMIQALVSRPVSHKRWKPEQTSNKCPRSESGKINLPLTERSKHNALVHS